MHDPALRERAKELRSKHGTLISVIAVDLGVPKSTVTRWLNPGLEKRERVKARKRKYGDGTKCPRCKRRKTARAKHCFRCAHELRRRWTKEALIEAIQQWAIEKGHAPTHSEWQRSGKNHPAVRSITDGPNPPFKTWSEALIAAGFTPRQRRSGKRKHGPGELKALRRRFREQKIIRALEKENDEHSAGIRDDAGVSDKAGGAASV